MRFVQKDHTDPVSIQCCLCSLSEFWHIIGLRSRARHAPPFGGSCFGMNIYMHLLRVRLLSQQGEHSPIEIAAIEGAFVRGISFDPQDRDGCNPQDKGIVMGTQSDQGR
jgi:hypothetical protein